MLRFKSLTILSVCVLAGGALVIVISAMLVVSGINRTLDQRAMTVASSWADYVIDHMPDVERLMDGRLPTDAQEHVLSDAMHLGDVFRWKFLDIDGRVRLDSDYVDAMAAGAPLPQGAVEHELDEIDQHGLSHVHAGQGDGVDTPLRYAAAQEALIVDGEQIGFLEVYVDQTAEAAGLWSTFADFALKIVALTGAAFLLPAIGFLWQSREQLATSRALAHAAAHDALTGLMNRKSFREKLDRRIAAAGPGESFRVLFLDLDKFKYVNDSKGHHAGDELLRQVADRLQRITGPDMSVCRQGGDEFALLEPVPAGGEGSADLPERLIAALSRPCSVFGDEVSVGLSIGIACYPVDGRTGGELLKAADLALYEAKELGRGRFRCYEPVMEVRRDRRIAIELRLRRAVALQDFEIAYQPHYRRDTAALAGFEALMRMNDEEGRPLSPADFIPVAEETELIVPLGKAVLARACRDALSWPQELAVSVNLSPVQFLDGTLTQAVREALETSGLTPQRLELEVTETVLMSQPDSVALQLDALKELGVSIALDDFGTGYSSLSYLWRFPFDKLKIDGSFMSSLEQGDERSLQVLRTIVALGEVLHLQITAEGIETDRQAREIDRLNVDFVQGYLYGRPVALDALGPVIAAAASQAPALRPKPARRVTAERQVSA